MAFEIEFRGPLAKSGFQKLLKFLRVKGKFLRILRRKTFVYYTKDKNLDLKVRTTNSASEIVLKKGFWGARKREEIIIPISSKSVKLAQKFLAALGYMEGIIASRETNLFEYENIEFALVKCPKNYYFYEAEFINNNSIKDPGAHIKKILKGLGLKVWSEKETYDFLMFCNKKIDEHFKFN